MFIIFRNTSQHIDLKNVLKCSIVQSIDMTNFNVLYVLAEV